LSYFWTQKNDFIVKKTTKSIGIYSSNGTGFSGTIFFANMQGCQQPTLAKEKRTQLDKREFYAPKKDVFHCPPSFDYNDFRCWNTLISLFL